MSEFRDKLIALGRGTVTLAEVEQSLQRLAAERPQEIGRAHKLLNAARRGGLPEHLHTRLMQLTGMAVTVESDATQVALREPAENATWVETVIAEPGWDEDTAATSANPAASAKPNSSSAPDAHATIVSKREDATVARGSEDVTQINTAQTNTTGRTTGVTRADATATDITQIDATQINSGSDLTQISRTGPASDVTRLRPANEDATAFNAFTDSPAAAHRQEEARTVLLAGAAQDNSGGLDTNNPTTADTTGGDTNDSTWDTNITRTPDLTGEVVFREGSVLRNRFKLETKLGEGGMGAVWKGVDKLKQEARDRNPFVAIKLLQGDFRDHPEAFIALQRETAKQQRLAHPNIATVFDFDRDDNTNTVFMTMEVLTGADLATYINRKLPAGGLPYEEAMAFIEQLGSGLAYAHQAGLVHSDLKPGNCFLTEDHTVKLLDFGIARASKTKADESGETTVFDPGELGALTPAYATIEMFEGDAPDPRDDIYAMAIISYQLLTGKQPFGRGMNAIKAEATGLVVPPIDKLTKAQNRALARGLAFRRKDRTETVEEFLEGLRPKKRNITLTIAPVAVGLALVLGLAPVISSYLDKEEREATIAIIETDARAGIEQAMALDPAQARLVLDDQRTRAAVTGLFAAGQIDRGIEVAKLGSADFYRDIMNIPAVEDAVVDVYREQAMLKFSPAKGRLDFKGAMAEVEALKKVVPRAGGVIQLTTELEKLRTETLRQLEGDFAGLIERGQILAKEDGDDIFKIRDKIAQLEPQNDVIGSNDVTTAAGELAKRAFAAGELKKAQALLAASLRFAPQSDNNANLRDEVEQALRQQANAKLVAEIETRLSAQQERLTSLSAFQEVRDDLIKLADLSPHSEVFLASQSRLTQAFDAELKSLAAAKNWLGAEDLLVGFAKLFSLQYLDTARLRLSQAEEKAGFAMARAAERRAAIDNRRQAIAALIQKPVLNSDWEIKLQVPFKEMIALLPAGDPALLPVREQIAALFVQASETAREAKLTTRAASLVDRGRAFYPQYAAFDAQLQRIAETNAQLEAARQEAARIGRVERNYTQAVNQAQADNTQAAQAALELLRKDAREQDAKRVTEAARQLGLAFGRLAQSPARQEDWGKAKKLIELALQLAPDDEKLLAEAATYADSYQKVAAVERLKELLRGKTPLKASVIGKALTRVKADFPEKYKSDYRRDFANLASTRLEAASIASPNDLKRIAAEMAIIAKHFGVTSTEVRKRLAPRLAQRVRELESSADAVKANDYLQAALKVAPDAPQLTSITFILPSPLVAQGLTLVAEGKLTQAQTLLAKVRKQAPNAQNLPAFEQALGARKQLAERHYKNYAKLKKRRLRKRSKPHLEQAIVAWSDNSAFNEELKSLGEAGPPASRYQCMAKKAGQGRHSRATCHDSVAGKRGPVLVVVPAGGGNAAPYAIGKIEVTVADYNLYCAAAGCRKLDAGRKLPATGVSLEQIEAYTAWLSKETGARYRLPTDSEWEHAANASGKQPHKDFNCTVTVGNQILKGHSLVTALSGKQNGWGLINYIGNAKEMVRTGSNIAVRGGGFTDPMAKCNVSSREQYNGKADPHVGFRLLREIG
ncbi:MAG: protein kinase [Gammaproteobacteria bacterium]|nr:protein kinase [Gammaproteobacteria bacterium]